MVSFFFFFPLMTVSVSFGISSEKLQLKRRGGERVCCRKEREREREREKMEKTKRIEDGE